MHFLVQPIMTLHWDPGNPNFQIVIKYRFIMSIVFWAYWIIFLLILIAFLHLVHRSYLALSTTQNILLPFKIHQCYNVNSPYKTVTQHFFEMRYSQPIG